MPDNKWPKISIVTPSFNQGRYLEATIDSVLSQGYPNLEYIIIDGGSTDQSPAIIKAHASHLHFWRSRADEGHYCAVNEGFSSAGGDIFGWLNSDDLYNVDTLKTVGSVFLEFPTISWLTTLRQRVVDQRGRCRSVKRLPGFSRQAFLDGRYFTGTFSGLGYIQQESTFWRRELWEQTGGIRARFSLAGDFDLWARFFLRADLYGIDHPLGSFRMHARNRSRQRGAYLREARRSLAEMRRQASWKRATGVTAFWDTIRWSRVWRRVAEICLIPRKPTYTAPVITQTGPGQTSRWRMLSSDF